MQGQYKNSYSTERQLNLLVPQGSVAGPVLYLAYASTLEEVIKKENATKNQPKNGTKKLKKI